MTDLKEWCVCIKFYFKLGKNAVKAFKMLNINIMSRQYEEHLSLSGFPSSKAV